MRLERGHGRGFVASDFALVNTALERIVEERLARGPLFCEWGSGFGVVAMLASMLSFEAYGIEVQCELVLAAEELADYFGCDVRFAHGSFVASCDQDLIESAERSWWHTNEGSAYEDLDLEPEDFDLFFAYPWPGGIDENGFFYDLESGAGADRKNVLVRYDNDLSALDTIPVPEHPDGSPGIQVAIPGGVATYPKPFGGRAERLFSITYE